MCFGCFWGAGHATGCGRGFVMESQKSVSESVSASTLNPSWNRQMQKAGWLHRPGEQLPRRMRTTAESRQWPQKPVDAKGLPELWRWQATGIRKRLLGSSDPPFRWRALPIGIGGMQSPQGSCVPLPCEPCVVLPRSLTTRACRAKSNKTPRSCQLQLLGRGWQAIGFCNWRG